LTKLRLLATAAVLLTTSNLAHAAQVFNTGVTAGGGLETPGQPDIHYPLFFPSTCCFSGLPTMVALPANIANGSYSGASAWTPNTATAQWTVYNGPTSSALFEFSTTFTLTPGDILAGNLQLSGMMAMASNFVRIQLNATSDTDDAFTTDFGAALHPFTVTSGFVSGENKLTFVQEWTDANQIAFGNSFQGLLVDQLTLTGGEGGGAVPEPSTYAMLGLGLAGLAYRRFRSVSNSN